MRFLYKVRVSVDKIGFTLNCQPLNNLKDTSSPKIKTISFRGNEEQFRKFLYKVKSKDTVTTPASTKNRTYKQMVDQILDGTDPYIYIWSNMLPKTAIINAGSFFESDLSAKEWLIIK